VLLYEKSDSQQDYVLKLPDALTNAGHAFVPAARSLIELKMDVGRVSRFVKKTAADAWVVMAGSRPVLEWFSAQSFPVFALFGRRQELPIAGIGPDYQTGHVDAVRHLAGLGHRRIVMLVRRERRLPDLGPPERAFIGELQALGLHVSNYNLPDWEETREGLRKVLTSLFRVTPPTALIVDEPNIFTATQQFLAEQGFRVPHEVSLISTENHHHFKWCATAISHCQWDKSRIIPRILRWAKSVSQGHRDIRQTVLPAKFIPGGTIGRAPRNVT
jgi:DNA-binding LacI/PurR family transcriptional regulator